MTNLAPQAPQLSSRMLRVTLLWVIILIASVIYTLFLSWRMEATTVSVRTVAGLQREVYEMGQVVAVSQQGEYNYDIQGSVWRIDKVIQTSNMDDYLPYQIMARDERLDAVFHRTNAMWKERLKPTLLKWNADHRIDINEREQFFSELTVFTQYISEWISLIEAGATRNIVVLRYTQVALGIASVLSIIIAMWFLVVSVIRPLNQLQTGIERLRASDWKTQVHAEGTLEFSHISTGFNDLANHLDDVYRNLENKVAEKTSSLAENNKYLTSLYGLTAFLGEQHSLNELCESFLARVLSIAGGIAGDIRFIDEETSRTTLVCQNGFQEVETPDTQKARDFFNEIVAHPQPKVLYFDGYPLQVRELEGKAHYVKIYHIRHKQKNIGLVTIFFTHAPENDPNMDTLLENLGQHMGTAVENLRLAELDQQMAVGQERNLMAQNLHDSIAQTLSFLNLQVQMLESALKQKNQPLVEEGIQQIKAGVQECYDDVRELLLNFRTRVSTGGFDEIVKSVLERFERQTHVHAHLTILGDGLPLTHAQKLQAIFILQEALSNVRKHAKAENVLVTVRNKDDFEMTIMDDGVGIDPELLEARKQRHVGLSIMKERAQRVSGQIFIDSEKDQGTTVKFLLSKDERTPI
mgnify:CR=1 FL=1